MQGIASDEQASPGRRSPCWFGALDQPQSPIDRGRAASLDTLSDILADRRLIVRQQPVIAPLEFLGIVEVSGHDTLTATPSKFTFGDDGLTVADAGSDLHRGKDRLHIGDARSVFGIPPRELFGRQF